MDGIRVYAVSGRDPVACIALGLHHLVTGELLLFGVHVFLLVAWATCLGVYAAMRYHFETTCCYGDPGPTAAEYRAGGSCTDRGALMYGQPGVCASTPMTLVIPLVLGCFFLGVQTVCYFWTYRRYETHMQGRLREWYHAFHDTQLGHLVQKQLQCMQLFPVTGLLCALPERTASNGRFFWLRLIMLVLSVVADYAAYVVVMTNVSWGCYADYDDETLTDKGVLDYGLCYDVRSVAYAATHGAYLIWLPTEYVGGIALFSTFVWLYLVVGRLNGVWFGSVCLMSPLHADYSHMVKT